MLQQPRRNATPERIPLLSKRAGAAMTRPHGAASGAAAAASGFRIGLVRNPAGAMIALMKTTIDIPDDELSDAMRFTRAKTKREAVVTALADFNRRRRMAELVEYAGTCPGMMTVDELHAQRWERMNAGDPD